MNSSSQMLSDRMDSGRMPVGESIRLGMALADHLRQLHEQGTVHGALSPATVEFVGNGVQLYAAPGEGKSVTPYTAPEVLQGKPADARSDIFSFGAIFYEMLTGAPAFEGATPEALANAIRTAAPRPSGSLAVDRLIAACLAKSPDGRFQRAHKLMLELKLLSSAARRGAPAPVAYARPAYVPPAPAPVAPPPVAPPLPAASQPMHDLESRIAARLEEQERSVASVAQVANEVLRALREQQHPEPAHAPAPRMRTRSFTSSPLDDHSAGRLEHVIDALADKLARLDLVVSSTVERLQKLEENLEAFDTDAAALRDTVTRDIRNFERTLKAQSTAIESARTAMGQTDDLVERVVEALDALQSMFVNTPDERSLAS